MSTVVRGLAPMAEVRSVPDSITFYRRLGFAVDGDFVPPGQSEASWALLISGRAHLLVTRTNDPKSPPDRVLFYCYCDDVPAMRTRLLSEGVAVGEIAYPFYAPRGEFRIEDPDGYVVMITHT